MHVSSSTIVEALVRRQPSCSGHFYPQVGRAVSWRHSSSTTVVSFRSLSLILSWTTPLGLFFTISKPCFLLSMSPPFSLLQPTTTSLSRSPFYLSLRIFAPHLFSTSLSHLRASFRSPLFPSIAIRKRCRSQCKTSVGMVGAAYSCGCRYVGSVALCWRCDYAWQEV